MSPAAARIKRATLRFSESDGYSGGDEWPIFAVSRMARQLLFARRMARLDSTAVWFLRGENEEEMASTPSIEVPRRRLPTVMWIALVLALVVAIAGGVLLHVAHASRVVDAPLASPSAAATASAAVLPTQIAAPSPPPFAHPADPPAPAPAARPVAHAPAATARPTTPRPSPELLAAEKLLRRGHPAAALAQFQQLLGRDADDVRALRGACLSLARLGRLDDAARVCRRAIDRAPDDLETRRALATIYYDGGAYKWSAAEWRRVVERAPHDAHARRALRAAEKLSSRG